MNKKNDVPYFVKEDGKTIEVPSIDDLCKMVRTKVRDLQATVDRLSTENTALKMKMFEDAEIKKLKAQHEEDMESLRNGFPVSDKEMGAINEWISEHNKQCHKATGRKKMPAGIYTYMFTPTVLGVAGYIRCSCGREFCFREPDAQ